MIDVTYGVRPVSINIPLKNTVYGRPISFSFPCKAYLCASDPCCGTSVSLPNSEGTKSFAPAALAASARDCWEARAARPKVDMTTSIPDRAFEREDESL